MARLAMNGLHLQHHVIHHPHWHVPVEALVVLALTIGFTAMFGMVHFFGAALITVLVGVGIARAVSK